MKLFHVVINYISSKYHYLTSSSFSYCSVRVWIRITVSGFRLCVWQYRFPVWQFRLRVCGYRFPVWQFWLRVCGYRVIVWQYALRAVENQIFLIIRRFFPPLHPNRADRPAAKPLISGQRNRTENCIGFSVLRWVMTGEAIQSTFLFLLGAWAGRRGAFWSWRGASHFWVGAFHF